MKYAFAIEILTAVLEVQKLLGLTERAEECERGIALMKLHEAFPEIEGTANATDTPRTSH